VNVVCHVEIGAEGRELNMHVADEVEKVEQASSYIIKSSELHAELKAKYIDLPTSLPRHLDLFALAFSLPFFHLLFQCSDVSGTSSF
jgi:hypothetical protein